ncbi:MAG: TlpA family protein disulfide reductase [Ectothiorhodospiraceae bacterium]|nr:TlpA family protein disulfide reductase [Ectothiorhodospiraceae bacterium]
MKLKETLIAVAAVAIIAGAGVVWLAPWEGDRAPDVTFTTLDGDAIQLSELRGAPTLVTFWATTCVTCIQEIPYLQAMQRDYSDRGFNVIAVAMEYDPPNQVRALAEARELIYPVAMDRDGGIARAFGDVRLTPTTFLIGPNGQVLQRRLGMFDEERMREQIERLLPAEPS